MTGSSGDRTFHLSEPEKGVVFALMAHLIWGSMALYFSFLRQVNPLEVIANRGLWSLPIAAVIIAVLGQFGDVRRALFHPRILATLSLTTVLVVTNWTLYVWAIEAGRTLEASLGYFINPLLNVVVGYLFLGERFSRLQGIALIFAVVAVLIQTFAAGVFPWLGLTLASSFCLYGFLRKTVAVGPTQGFFIEVLIAALPMLLIEYWFFKNHQMQFGSTTTITLLLMGGGVLTTSSLIFFAASVRRLRYSTTGLLQYISPSLVFLTAVFILHEPIDRWRLLSFIILWTGLVIYTYAMFQQERRRRKA